jgi:cell shape-determining protein MreD
LIFFTVYTIFLCYLPCGSYHFAFNSCKSFFVSSAISLLTLPFVLCLVAYCQGKVTSDFSFLEL